MMRYLIILVILGAFAAQSFNRAAIVWSYHLNTSAFAQKCENKARPQLKCQGKCQLMKKLQEEEKKEQQAPDRGAENKMDIFFSGEELTALLPSAAEEIIPYQGFVVAPTADQSFAIFHPPASV